MRVYKLKLAKLTEKMAKIRPGATNGRTAERPPPKRKRAKSTFFAVFYVKKNDF